ncbi:aminotransferase class III-fold pyridoxal phosphate-dependent enzyme, partial [Thermus scotoductus]|uniref:aminotransferase class III-fold pyridoxal phosphate-dependent enzyme n=1 Tax=Thermus scotoductus TaxID=37636 RepID=UPI001291507B
LVSQPQWMLAANLGEITPEGVEMVFCGNSGAEGVEAGMRLARVYAGKPGIVTTHGGFRGKAMGALSLTPKPEYQDPAKPLLPGVKAVPYGDLEALEGAIDEGTGAVIVEPIQGEGGIRVPPDGYLKGVGEITREKGVRMIADEVQTGLGRTGKLFG